AGEAALEVLVVDDGAQLRQEVPVRTANAEALEDDRRAAATGADAVGHLDHQLLGDGTGGAAVRVDLGAPLGLHGRVDVVDDGGVVHDGREAGDLLRQGALPGDDLVRRHGRGCARDGDRVVRHVDARDDTVRDGDGRGERDDVDVRADPEQARILDRD